MWSYKWIEKTKACLVLGQTSPACVDTALLTRPPNYGDGLSPVGGVWIHKKDLGLTATWLAQPILRPAPSRVATGHQHTKLVDQYNQLTLCPPQSNAKPHLADHMVNLERRELKSVQALRSSSTSLIVKNKEEAAAWATGQQRDPSRGRIPFVIY